LTPEEKVISYKIKTIGGQSPRNTSWRMTWSVLL
jgi:hypothetical protein